MWKNLELEWKILILACVLFVAIAWPLQYTFISRLNATLEQSIDTNLEPLLRANLENAQENERSAIIASLERNRQWKAMIPIIVREQQRAILGFSLVLLLTLALSALYILRRMTRPLRSLAGAVEQIGKGEKADVRPVSGGALGTVEYAVEQLQDELEVLRRKAHLQGMEKAWQDIARIMAHEIKNPLTPIRLTLDRIEEKAACGQNIPVEVMNKFLQRINGQVDVLEKLVNQFRSFAREPEANPKPVAIHESIANIADTMEKQIAAHIEGSASISADPYLLNQVLLNIWKNALEAGADAIDVMIQHSGDIVAIRIRDNGPGVDKKDLERIWLPYVSMKKGGTGLGLPVVKRLIETMNGTVELQSDAGQHNHGLTIKMKMPRA